jgi:ribonucleoside-diphosphate reductase alpha chain
MIGGGEKKAFEQRDVEFPEAWSQNAVNITASKYFRGVMGTGKRERSVKQIITRVVKTIRGWGERFGYFARVEDAETFEAELTHLLVHQKAAFNSPVWFNVGIKESPQCSACFILSVEDDMRSILQWITNEGMIFKHGSGAGVNLSPLRSKRETLGTGGSASGPVSFMRGADAVAGMIKSGGATRRAAKMVVMNIDHPDVMDFIRCKAEEEKKIRALADAGFDMSNLNSDAWNSIQFQNANNSVRITDDFMHAVEKDGEWQTRFVKSGEPADTYKARHLLNEIAQAAWECGDPGVQFDTVINDWHTCANTGRINASNPCSEYMHLDNTACNLASINLMKFLREDGSFMTEDFRRTIDVLILAQEIIVGGSSYPTEKIGENAVNFRQLGLGYANLGTLLMTKSLPYDSEKARAWAGAISSLLSGEAYRYSAVIAGRIGAFAGYAVNREPMLRVMGKHRDASRQVNINIVDDASLGRASQDVWDDALRLGEKHGYRNSQVTVIAPTGTIGLMMDCDTTGVEPDFSLVKMKQLVGGGWMKIVNGGVPRALRALGYNENETADIIRAIGENGTIEGAPHIKEEHLPVFDCAVKPAKGERSISWRGHVKMVGAVQPFISGAISKTFNMPNEVTKEEISESYVMAWKLGIKAFAVYRDGSKATQPLNTSDNKKSTTEAVAPAASAASAEPAPVTRRRLPTTRISETHKFSIGGHGGFLTYSTYDDGSLAEIFIRVAKQGSTLAGLLDSFAIAVSLALQYGVPLKALARKFIHSRFEPSGFTKNPDIQVATSIVDYIFRYLALRFLSENDLDEFGMKSAAETPSAQVAHDLPELQQPSAKMVNGFTAAGTVCKNCGGMMFRTGTCMTCLACGTSSGGCS